MLRQTLPDASHEHRYIGTQNLTDLKRQLLELAERAPGPTLFEVAFVPSLYLFIRNASSLRDFGSSRQIQLAAKLQF